MTLDEMIVVLQAAKEIKPIECKRRHETIWGPWPPTHWWNFDDYDYRVKRKPYVVFINAYADGSLGQAYLDSEKAAAVGDHLGKVVKFIEVID